MKALTFDDISLIPQYNNISSRADVSLKSVDKKNNLILNLPIFSSNMDTITGPEMTHFMTSKGGMGILHRFSSIEKNVLDFDSSSMCFVSIGITDIEIKRFEALANAGATKFCIDIAHGHSKAVLNVIDIIKKSLPRAVVMAGNVCTYEGAKFLEDAGADLVKIGQGSGSVCTTRIKTGHGVPQLSAIRDCARVGVSIIADGGIRAPGDIVKALAFGADYVMIGSMLAGTWPTPGENKTYRGMASKEANVDQYGGLSSWRTAEGVAVPVLYKGKAETDEIIQDIVGGLRSGLTYSGVSSIKELQEKKKYVHITQAGLIEGYPHRLNLK